MVAATPPIFSNERVKVTEDLTSGNGHVAEIVVTAGSEGVALRERVHPIWRRCWIVYFNRGVRGRPMFAYVPARLLESLEADRAAHG